MSLYIMTLAEAKSILGITDTVDDATLTIWLSGLQGRFDQHCRRAFLYGENVTEYFDGGVTELLARRYPIDSVSSIIVDQDQAWSADEALDSADYVLNAVRGRVYYGTGKLPWPSGVQNIRMIYDGGFVKSDGTAATNVEDAELEALRRCFMLQANYEWRNRKILGISQVSQQGATVHQGAQVPLALKQMTLLPEVESGLQPFVRMI